MDSESCLQRFQERAATILAQYQPISVDGTPRLFHYTDAAGLLGIISGHTLRLTHARYLSDPGELSYAADMINAEVSKYADKHGPIVDKAVESTMRNVKFGAAHVFPFVSCFCENGDMLSQWRGYGGKASGYAIGFDYSTSLRLCQTEDSNTTMLRQVIYDPDVQRYYVAIWIEALIGLVRELNDDPPVMHYAQYLATLADFMFSFKSPAYREEQEWRLVDIVGPHTKFKFTASPQFLRPYVEFSCTNGKLPIKNVVVGPATDLSLAQSSVELLLRANGYEDVTVVPSAIQHRP